MVEAVAVLGVPVVLVVLVVLVALVALVVLAEEVLFKIRNLPLNLRGDLAHHVFV